MLRKQRQRCDVLTFFAKLKPCLVAMQASRRWPMTEGSASSRSDGDDGDGLILASGGQGLAKTRAHRRVCAFQAISWMGLGCASSFARLSAPSRAGNR